MNNEVFKSVIENSTDLTIITDTDGTVTYVSPQCKDVIGYPRKDILGNGIPDFINPEDREMCMEAWKGVMAGKPLRNFEYRILDKKGKERWLSHSAKCITSGKEKVGMQNIMRDITQQKGVEKELLSREERWQSMAQNASNFVTIVDRDHQIEYINHPVPGLKLEDVVGRKVYDFIQPEYHDIARKRISSVFTTGNKCEYTIAATGPNGKPAYYHTCLGPIIVESEIIAVSLFGTDITERKQAEDALHKSEAGFRELFTKSRDANLLLVDGVQVDCNEACLEMLKATREQVVGKSPISLSPERQPDGRLSLDAAQVYIRDAMENGSNRFEWVLKRMDGTEFWVEVVTTVMDINGKKGLFGVWRDINERKLAEEALLNEKSLSEEYINSLPGLFYVFDEKRFVHWNENWETVTGYSAAELGRMYGPDFFHGSDIGHIANRMKKVFEDGISDAEAELITKEGRRIPYYFSGIRKLFNGKPHLVGLGIDISELKKAREELENAQKLESIGTLAAGIAHDFNNMLGSVFGYIDLALERAAGDQKQTYYLEKAIKAHSIAKDLTGQLLTFSKGGGPNKSAVSISSILHETEHMALSGSNVRCEYTVTKKLRLIDADKGQLSQVFTNILINSRHAMPDGGTIAVKCSNRKLKNNQVAGLNEGHYVQVVITDSGVGIPKELLSKVFDPFFTTKQIGSGLGLATTYSIIGKHNGNIAIDSTPGVGTSITILLPATHGKLSEEHSKPTPDTKGTGRVLIMDDDEMLLAAACEQLKRLGYSFESAGNGEETVELYGASIKEKRKFDVVILDLTVVGGMGGLPTIRNLLEIDPDVKGIVSSGYSDDPVLDEPGKFGFSGKIAKPYLKSELAVVLSEVIGSK